MSGEQVNEELPCFQDRLPDVFLFHHDQREENSKKPLQDSSQLLEKEDFQNVLEFAVRKLAEGDGDSAIEQLADFLFKESRSAIDVKTMGDGLKENDQYVQAMILYKISHDLHKKGERLAPDDELEWIDDRLFNMYDVVTPLISTGEISRKVALNIGMKFFGQSLEEIRGVTNASPDQRARVEAFCLGTIAQVQGRVDQFEDSIRLGEEGLSIMMQQFGENASNYRLYGMLLQTLGTAYLGSGRCSDAEQRYVAAIETKERASYYKSDKEKQDEIAHSKLCLEISRGMLAKQK